MTKARFGTTSPGGKIQVITWVSPAGEKVRRKTIDRIEMKPCEGESKKFGLPSLGKRRIREAWKPLLEREPPKRQLFAIIPVAGLKFILVCDQDDGFLAAVKGTEPSVRLFCTVWGRGVHRQHPDPV